MAKDFNEVRHVFSPLQVGYITGMIEPLNASSTVEWALEFIADRPDIEVLPIERNGAVLGVVSRQELEKLAASAWSRFWQKDLDVYIISAKGTIEATSYIDKLIEQSANINRNEAVWYIVQHRRAYLGIVSLRQMMEYTNILRSQDLKTAGEIQEHLLKKAFVSDKRFSLFFFNTMAHEIGGDFYRVYQSDKDHYLVACFDVAGKNISGAMTTMALGACFAAFELFQYMTSADKMTNRINALIKNVNPPGIFVAAILFYIDLAVKQIRIHNCGFSPVLIFVPVSDNRISYKISYPGLAPLGIEDEFNFSECPIIPITRGLRICAYSDGLTDMSNIYGERYGDEQTTALIKGLHRLPPEKLRKTLNNEISKWIGTASLADDVTLVDMRFN
jgi:sigma-B regulation protein RsbU (phosphoserine phosphatase)